MSIEIRVPSLGESVTEATISQWFKKEGDAVAIDEPLVELETDKVTIEVPASAAGVLARIDAQAGETVNVGALLGQITEGGAPAKAAPQADQKSTKPEPVAGPEPIVERAAAPAVAAPAAADASPAVRRLVTENNVDPAAIQGTGKDGRLLK